MSESSATSTRTKPSRSTASRRREWARWRELYAPQGYNLGWNLGRIAGAGITDHVHLHLVPRWAGDTNFMPVLADLKVLPEHLAETRRKLAEPGRRPLRPNCRRYSGSCRLARGRRHSCGAPLR